jgi:alkylation response protein AidB-like acyl-CoA dehydrogenase
VRHGYDPAAPKIVHGFLSRGTAGVTIKETWDVLGMRATRSDEQPRWG